MTKPSELPDLATGLAILEAELSKKERRRPNHPSHTKVHPLTAREEAGRYKRSPKAKKYDGRAHSKDAVVSRQKVREALESFYKEVRMPDVKQALEVSNDPRYNMLLAAINNPRFVNCSFAELCRKCRMSIQDVVEIWRNHMKTQGIVRMMGHMPDIMEDVAIDSKSKMVTCDTCQGQGVMHGREVNKIKDPICPVCHGDGTLRVQGDKDARLLAFETVGLRKGNVGQVNVLNVTKGIPLMEDQIANIDRVFEAEYTEVTEETNEQPTNNAITGDAPTTEGPGDTGIKDGEHADLTTPNTPYQSDDDYPTDPTDYSS